MHNCAIDYLIMELLSSFEGAYNVIVFIIQSLLDLIVINQDGEVYDVQGNTISQQRPRGQY